MCFPGAPTRRFPGASDACPLDARNLCDGAVAVDRTRILPIRLNAIVSGSAECAGIKVDCRGHAWAADFGYNSSSAAGTCNLGGGGEACVVTGIAEIFGCENEETEDLFQCGHWDSAAAPELEYSFDVPDGEYLVNLFFANTVNGTDGPFERVFDIVIEGETVYDNFDQVASAGGSGVRRNHRPSSTSACATRSHLRALLVLTALAGLLCLLV